MLRTMSCSIGRIISVAITFLSLSACSKISPPPPYGETAEFRAWRGKHAAIPIQGAYFATRIDGQVTWDLSAKPSTHPEDWIEVIYNGTIMGRTFVHSAPGTAPRIVQFSQKFYTGPMNRVAFFDTVTNRGHVFNLDTRTLNGQNGKFVIFRVGDDFDVRSVP